MGALGGMGPDLPGARKLTTGGTLVCPFHMRSFELSLDQSTDLDGVSWCVGPQQLRTSQVSFMASKQKKKKPRTSAVVAGST